MIDGVRMVNWRAYADRTVPFEPGLTFVVGANGAGKTSILEAIVYALTGESTVAERTRLLRSPDRLATVTLEFTVDGEKYLVERSQSLRRAEVAVLRSPGIARPLMTTQRKVTEEIERLTGVSAGFLRRMVYMAEGDVYRFLSEPPHEALATQAERVLGLSQLDEFAAAIREAGKQVRILAREVGEQLGHLRPPGGPLGDGEATGPDDQAWASDRARVLEERRGRLIAELRSVQDDIAAGRRADDDRQRLGSLLGEARAVLREDPALWAGVLDSSALEVLAELEKQVASLQARVDGLRQGIARLEGERTASDLVLEVLAASAADDGATPCPVCQRPLRHDDRQSAVESVRANLDRLDGEAAALSADLAEAVRQLAWQSAALRSVRRLHDYLTHVPLPALGSGSSFRELEAAIAEPAAGRGGSPDELERRVEELDRSLAALEDERSAYVSAVGQLQKLGYRSPEEAREGLVALEARSIALHAAERAVEETLADQRNVDLRPVLDQVAAVWGSFSGDRDWEILLDEQGLPLLRDGRGRQLDLSQFSGGEKTALLVMVHAIVALHLSRSRFLLIDEPLEHLDPINRRSLIRFLVDAGRKQLFAQAIVTTCEESLVRQYLSDEGVHAIYL